MNYKKILDEKDKNISRIDEFIDFLRKNFKELDKYNQLVALLNKEKKLYLKLGEKDSNDFTKELKDIGYQISLKILEIKNNKINVIHEINSEDKKKILESDKLLDENIPNIKKELCNKLENLFSYPLCYNKNTLNKIKDILEDTFCNCDCKGSPQAKILEALSNIKKDEEISITDEIKKELFNKGIVKEKFSDKFIKKKKEELLNNEAIKIKNELFFNKHFKYYLTNSFEQKSIKDHLNTFLKFQPLILSGISLFSMILYFKYFGVELRYFPTLSGSEIIYVGMILFSVSSVIFLLLVIPIISYSHHLISRGLFIVQMVILLCILGYFYYEKIYVFAIIAVIVLIVYCCLYFYGIRKIYNNGDFKWLLLAILTAGIFYSPMLFTSQVASWLEISNVNYKYLIIEKSSAGALPEKIYDISKISQFENSTALSYTNNTLSIKDNNNYLNLSISPRYLSFFYQDKELKDLEKASNIIYRNNMLYCDIYENTIYKKAIQKGGITVKMKEKEHITYTEQHGDTIWLHNIKAISTLGKFYYLETKDGEKFELDSSKIISRANE